MYQYFVLSGEQQWLQQFHISPLEDFSQFEQERFCNNSPEELSDDGHLSLHSFADQGFDMSPCQSLDTPYMTVQSHGMTHTSGQSDDRRHCHNDECHDKSFHDYVNIVYHEISRYNASISNSQQNSKPKTRARHNPYGHFASRRKMHHHKTSDMTYHDYGFLEDVLPDNSCHDDTADSIPHLVPVSPTQYSGEVRFEAADAMTNMEHYCGELAPSYMCQNRGKSKSPEEAQTVSVSSQTNKSECTLSAAGKSATDFDAKHIEGSSPCDLRHKGLISQGLCHESDCSDSFLSTATYDTPACGELSMSDSCYEGYSSDPEDSWENLYKLTHWDLNRMADIFSSISLNGSYSIIIQVPLKFVPIEVTLTISQHWFR